MSNRVTSVCLRLLLVALLLPLAARASEPPQPRKVVLVTLDGVRTQEMFDGMDANLLQAELGKNAVLQESPYYRQFWAETSQARRQKLMPFLWGELLQSHGAIAGNAALGSRVQVENRYWFSSPGYVELLTGRARDADVDSNAMRNSPKPTVLEFVRERLALAPKQVAALGSWDRFQGLPAQQPGNIFINAGFMPYASPDVGIQRLDVIQAQARIWPHERFDAFTAAFALDYLARERPRLLYVALGDTDEWAHAGNYRFTLDALHQADDFLRQLWQWLQSQPDYRDSTTLIITTDHGRGRGARDWTDHGPDVAGAQDIWVAIAGAGVRARGEWHDVPLLWQGQVAATIAGAFGLNLRQLDPGVQPPIALPGL